jgi:hypothetical protein
VIQRPRRNSRFHWVSVAIQRDKVFRDVAYWREDWERLPPQQRASLWVSASTAR